jgi:hypothetical protein
MRNNGIQNLPDAQPHQYPLLWSAFAMRRWRNSASRRRAGGGAAQQQAAPSII